MSEKPILFNTDMVKAILDGRKTQTRRVIHPHLKKDEAGWMVCLTSFRKPYAIDTHDDDGRSMRRVPAPYQRGDVLWVREAWAKDIGRYMYRANYSDTEKFYMNGREIKMAWRPSIHMPREAARLFLRVKDVRIEKLQDISPLDINAEGIKNIERDEYDVEMSDEAMEQFMFEELWDSTINPADLLTHGWESNPWVWVIEFERMEGKA